MKNKLFIFVIFLVAFSFIYSYSENITGFSIYNVDDSFESSGRTITIRKISQSNAVIEVDGIKNIISVGDKKIINNVEIGVLDIFYVDEIESRNVELSINATSTLVWCGDDECTSDEDEDNCCIDCGCPDDYTCKDEECIYQKPNECRKHEDCEDEDPETEDICVDLKPKICKHYTINEDEEEDIIKEELNHEENESENMEETTENVEKQGFFSKLINFFKNLF